MNDLDLVAIVKQGVIEGAAGNDLAVQFDRDAAAVQAAFFDELRNALTAVYLELFAIDDDHACLLCVQ